MDLNTTSFIVHRLDVLQGDSTNFTSNNTDFTVLVGNEIFIDGLKEGIAITNQVTARVVVKGRVQSTTWLLLRTMTRKESQTVPSERVSHVTSETSKLLVDGALRS